MVGDLLDCKALPGCAGAGVPQQVIDLVNRRQAVQQAAVADMHFVRFDQPPIRS